MTLPRRMMMTVEECRQVAARIALRNGALMDHNLILEIDDLIADVVITAALYPAPSAPKPKARYDA